MRADRACETKREKGSRYQLRAQTRDAAGRVLLLSRAFLGPAFLWIATCTAPI